MEKSLNEYKQRFVSLEENLKVIRNRISEAAVKSGRTEKNITMLAATKTVPVPVINKGIELGINCIGENKVQELCDKYDELDLTHCSCQFIGHLQTNKVKYLIGKVSMIQSVDSMKLAKEISRLSVANHTKMDILIEVNIGCEENKSGVLPQNLNELISQISALPAVHARGLMAIPPICENNLEIAHYFSNMYKYFIDIKAKKLDNINMDYLSMGMSGDYEQAILEGANMVRIGSSLFGARIYNN